MIQPERPANQQADVAYEDLLELLADRLQAGESLDSTELAFEYPQFALRLEGLLPVMQAMLAIRESEGDAAPASDDDEGDSLLCRDLAGCRVLRFLGRGGTSLVYEAAHPQRGLVALKILSAAAARDARQIEAFWQAGHVGRRLHHWRIVPVFELGESQGRCFAVLKLISGPNLAVRIAEQWMRSSQQKSPDAFAANRFDRNVWRRRVIAWMIDAAEAVHAAHGQGIVHGDFKPANLLLDPRDRLWVGDFGGTANSDTSPSAAPLATLRYLSPERLTGGGPSVASDVYALGATLYELLALEPAFAACSPQRLRESIASDTPCSLREFDASVPTAVDALVMRCLAKDPAARPGSAQDVANGLRRKLPTGAALRPLRKIDSGYAPAPRAPWAAGRPFPGGAD
jgi:serine/threonine protein kinase